MESSNLYFLTINIIFMKVEVKVIRCISGSFYADGNCYPYAGDPVGLKKDTLYYLLFIDGVIISFVEY